MDSERTKDVKNIVREETARGTRRRVPDEAVVQERKLRIALMKELLQIEDGRAVERILIEEYGLQVRSAEYKNALKVWGEHQRSRP